MNSETEIFAKFQNLLDKNGIIYFDAKAILYLGASHNNPSHKAYQLNTLPDARLWRNIIPTINAIEVAIWLCDLEGDDFELLSIHRNPTYNTAIGSTSPNSLHTVFKAIDFTANSDEKLSKVYTKLLELQKYGVFKGGLKYYKSRRFIHVDTRGYNANW